MLCTCSQLFLFFFIIRRRPPRSTRTDTLFPYTTLFRSTHGFGSEPFEGPASVIAPWVGGVSQIKDDPEIDRLYGELNGAMDEARSEEHTSELQSLMSISYAVFCLKKKIE